MNDSRGNEEPQPPGSDRQPPPGTACVGVYRRAKEAHEHGLVILAMGLPYWLIPGEDGYGLYVHARYEAAVVGQIERYHNENRMWPPKEEVLPSGQGSAYSLALFVVVLWGFFLVADDAMVEAGLLSAGFLSGDWWRPVTALTLHGGWDHLMGNTVGGVFFMMLVFRFTGYGLGWFAVLASGILGNAINIAILAGAGHRSIGASTAVFAALGLVVGCRLLQAHRAGGWRWPRQLWIPVIGGVILLGMLGAGGERTDVMAHVWGFAAGGAAGAAIGFLRLDLKTDRLPQTVFSVLTVAILAAAWTAALASQ